MLIASYRVHLSKPYPFLPQTYLSLLPLSLYVPTVQFRNTRCPSPPVWMPSWTLSSRRLGIYETSISAFAWRSSTSRRRIVMLETPRPEFAASSRPSRPVLLNSVRILPLLNQETTNHGSGPTGTLPGVTPPPTVTHVVRDIPPRATPPRPMTRRNHSRMIRHLPKGDQIQGLVQLTNFRPEFQARVSYRRYRLADMYPIEEAEMTDYLHSFLKRMKQRMDYQFSGSPSIKVLDFLRSFNIPADVNRLSEGTPALVLPNFLSGRARPFLSPI
jgi:hypothetical protein